MGLLTRWQVRVTQANWPPYSIAPQCVSHSIGLPSLYDIPSIEAYVRVQNPEITGPIYKFTEDALTACICRLQYSGFNTLCVR